MNKRSIDKTNGFVSLTAIICFIFAMSFIKQSIMIINNYLESLSNLKIIERELAVEKVAINQAKRSFSNEEKENYCEFISDYEVCWNYYGDYSTITIDYIEYEKKYWLRYDFDWDCLVDISVKVDK